MKIKGWKICNRQITINKYGNINTSDDRIDDVVQFSSRLQLGNPVDRSMPDFPVPYHLQRLPKFMSTALVMPSSHLILWHRCLFLPSIFPSIRDFPSDSAVHISDQNAGASASASVLPMSIQAWFPLRLIGLISWLSKQLSEVFPSTTVQRHQFLVLCLHYGPALSTTCNHWEDHSLDYMDLCWQSDVCFSAR